MISFVTTMLIFLQMFHLVQTITPDDNGVRNNRKVHYCPPPSPHQEIKKLIFFSLGKVKIPLFKCFI